jgi:tetratricopeptide (TPR) repeat protein
MDLISQITSADKFVRLCKSLFCAEYHDFQTIDDSGGDGGNDGYSEKHEVLFQMYCPEKPEKANDATYKSKIKEDLDKAKALADSGKYKIKEWVFVTPRELREPVQTYLRTEATSRGFIGVSWSSPKLTELFTKYSHLRSQYPDLIQPDIEKQIAESSASIIGHLESVEDVKKVYNTKIEQNYQRKIDQAKDKMSQSKYETAKKEYELILNDLNSETIAIDPHIYFRTYNNLGVCELNLGNTQTAIDFFEKAYDVEPDFPMAVVNYALSKMLRGVSLEGLSIINDLLKKYPDDEHAISIKANILYDLKNYTELASFLREKNKIALAHLFEGMEKMSKEDFDNASISFENLLSLEPKNLRGLLMNVQNTMIGMQEVIKNNPFPPDKIPHEIKKKFDRAIQCLNEAVNILSETEQKEELETAYTNLSGCYTVTGQYNESITSAESATLINPKSEIPFLNKGISQLKLGKYREAIDSFQEYKKRGGRNPEVDGHIAYCSLKAGDLPTAEKIIEELLYNDGKLNINIAELAIDLYSRKLDDAKLDALLKRLEEEFPHNSQVLRMRSSYLHQRGLPGAEDLLKEALKNAITETEKMLASMELADIKFGSKDYSIAEEIYKKYLNSQEGNHATLRYAECLYDSGQYGALLEWADSLHEAVKNKPLIKQVCAYANLYLGNLDIASKMFKDLFEVNPGNLQYVVHYGMCRFRLGKENEARTAFDVVKNRITETQDLAILSGGYAFIGEWETAVELTFKALENDPNNPKAHLAFIFTFLRREQADEKDPEKKYIKAFQKSIGEFSNRFPEEKALQSFKVENGDISEMINMVDKIAETTDNATNLYRESKAPLAFIPKITGKKSFDVWTAFIQMEGVGIKMSFGSPDEFKLEAEIVQKCLGKSIVMDIYPLFLFAHFDRLDFLSKIFGKIHIHQAVMDEITGTIEDRKISAKKGLKILGKTDGQHHMFEISPEQIQKSIDLLEKIRTFISSDKNVEIRGLSKEKRKGKNISGLLDESTSDSILLAQEIEEPIFCDDRILRALAREEHGVLSFSSQTLLVVAQQNKKLSLDERYKLQKKLIDLNYEYIAIDANFIYDQLQSSNYLVDEIRNISAILAKKETSTESLCMVLSDVLFSLMRDNNIAGQAKLNIFRNILNQISDNHDIEKIKEGVSANIQMRFPDKLPQTKHIIQLFFSSTGLLNK